MAKERELRPARVNQEPISRLKLGVGLYSRQGARLNCSEEGRPEGAWGV